MKPPLRTKYDSTSSEPWASTGRLVGYSYNVNGQADTGTLAWNFWGSLGSLAIADGISGTSDSQTCDYGYDDLERLSGANCGSGWNQSFSYDAFGNQAKTASGGTQFNATFAVANNQIAEVGSYSPSYDANGNLLDDPVAGAAAYTWDADNHLHTVNGYTLVYDALGRVAEMQGGSSDAEVLYGPGGGKLALMNGNSSLTEAFLPLPGGATAVYNSSGLAYYRHPDMLGSSRLASTPARTLYSETAYGPDGEPYDTAGTADANFTGMNQDTVTGSSGLYDFPFRELSPTQGRWLSPDPAGIAAVDPSNPQTWNRYAYVAGNMLTATDPLGMDGDCYTDENSEGITVGCLGLLGPQGGGGGGGDCVPAPLYMSRPGGNVNIRYECDDDVPSGGGTSSTPANVSPPAPPVPTQPDCNDKTLVPLDPAANFSLAPNQNAVPYFAPQMAADLSLAIEQLNTQGIVPVLISGYRSPEVQTAIDSGPRPKAKYSYHEVGYAADLVAPGTSNSAIATVMAGTGISSGSAFSDPTHYYIPAFQNQAAMKDAIAKAAAWASACLK